MKRSVPCDRLLLMILSKSAISLVQNIVAFGNQKTSPKIASFPDILIIMVNNRVEGIFMSDPVVLSLKNFVEFDISEIRKRGLRFFFLRSGFFLARKQKQK